MKSIEDSQIFYLCVESILSWIGTDGQCLAALHFHISTLEPDQADSTLSVRMLLYTLELSESSSLREKRQQSQNSECDWWS